MQKVWKQEKKSLLFLCFQWTALHHQAEGSNYDPNPAPHPCSQWRSCHWFQWEQDWALLRELHSFSFSQLSKKKKENRIVLIHGVNPLTLLQEWTGYTLVLENTGSPIIKHAFLNRISKWHKQSHTDRLMPAPLTFVMCVQMWGLSIILRSSDYLLGPIPYSSY